VRGGPSVYRPAAGLRNGTGRATPARGRCRLTPGRGGHYIPPTFAAGAGNGLAARDVGP